MSWRLEFGRGMAWHLTEALFDLPQIAEVYYYRLLIDNEVVAISPPQAGLQGRRRSFLEDPILAPIIATLNPEDQEHV